MQEFMTKVNEAKVEYYKQKEYLENRIELRQQQIERLQKRRDKLVCPHYHDALKEIGKYICERKINITPKSPHKIRKTYATILLDGNVRESTILNSMGHVDLECTRGPYYYNRASIEDKREELSKLVEL